MEHIENYPTFAAQKVRNRINLSHYNNNSLMARPIKDTPVLRGKDARIFEEKINNPRTVSQAEVNAARESYERIMSIAQFKF